MGVHPRLNRDGHTIVLTTHYLEEAEALCGRIAMLKAGRIVALDTTQSLLSASRASPCALGAPRAGCWQDADAGRGAAASITWARELR